MELEEARKQKLYAAEKQMARARALIIVFGTAAFFMLSGPHIHYSLALGLLPAIWVYGAFVLIYKPYEKHPVFMASWFTYTSDGIFATLWIFATGGFYSPFHVLFYTSIIAVAYRFGLRTTLFSATLYGLCYAALLYITEQLGGNEGLVTVRIGFIFIIGLMAWMISRETLFQTQQKLQLARLMRQAGQDQQELRELNRTLKLQNELFNHAEQNARLGSFYWILPANKITYTDNLFRLLGHEPGDFEPSVESYGRFVHPDEKEEYRKRGEESIRTGTFPANVVQRVITRQGTVRYLKATARSTRENKDTIIIGTLQDITDDVALSETLRQKNAELEEINKELSSFNYVASHDLQEPLRKILTFSELIRDKEKGNLTPPGETYLERISTAARRMQHLIEAFLNYSHLGTARQEFESLDLNEVLAEVRTLMAEQLQEKNATLTTEHLPVIKGVRIQMQQLFINLIGNSLKYSREGVPPVITITVQEVQGVQADFTGNHPGGRFWKLSVSDNGIGFSREYYEKIFEVFMRLHSKDKYEGTGIGLAICRKVIAAHGGFIRAESVEGQGATFHIYLPLPR
jgi:signal transduction histidine kinase